MGMAVQTSTVDYPEQNGMWRDGKYLVVCRGALFPDRCIKTNEPAEGLRLAIEK